jgi:AraC family transcriptional regulator
MKDYQQRFENILNYIDKNLENEICIKTLSDLAYFSPFHFHRQFSAFIGQPLKQYIQMKRLHKAAFQLVYRQHLSIGEIASIAAFANSESLSRAFKQMFHQSPSHYRKSPQIKPWSVANKTLCKPNLATNVKQDKMRERMFDNSTLTNDIKSISVVDFPETKLAVYQHFGSPNKIMASVQHFIEWRKAHHTPPNQSKTYNLVYSDPSQTSENEFRFDIGAQITNEIEINEFGVVNQLIPPGRCAKYRHIGPDQFLNKSFNFLYGEWLPQSGETLRNFPCILERVKMFPEVPESEAIIDIYLPVI